MTIDHIGYAYHIGLFRLIGRISFPLYLFLLVNGFLHTKSRLNYFLRLFVCTAITQVAFYQVAGVKTLTVMSTLTMCFLLLQVDVILENFSKQKVLLQVWNHLIVAMLLFILGLDIEYGVWGCLLCYVFYHFHGDRASDGINLLMWFVVSMFSEIAIAFAWNVIVGIWSGPLLNDAFAAQTFALAAVPIIFLYNRKKGWEPKSNIGRRLFQYSFYAYYPLHIGVIYLVVHL